jgi:hypothetical protein
MKKLLLSLSLIFILTNCSKDKIFENNKFNTVYFPIQYPIRTLSLGNDIIDNSLDKEHKFHIGVNIGGILVNNRDWTVNFILNEELAHNVRTYDGDTILPLPQDYYTMTPISEVIIPTNSVVGLIEIQLKDAFFEDSLSHGNHYVIPLVITSSDADSILTGRPVVENPDRRITGDWYASAMPRDFTIFMIKYVNKYHGAWLHRGADFMIDPFDNSTYIDTVIYKANFIVEDQLWKLSTRGLNTVQTNGVANYTGSNYKMKLDIDANTNLITIDSVTGSKYMVYGIGESKWIAEGDEWGNKKRETIYLNYKYRDDSLYEHVVYDTLVFRDRSIHYEEYTIEVVK